MVITVFYIGRRENQEGKSGYLAFKNTKITRILENKKFTLSMTLHITLFVETRPWIFLVVRLISVKLQWVELRTRDRRADSSHCVDLHSVQTSFRIILVQFMTFISTNIKIGTWQPCISSLGLLVCLFKFLKL